jgi:hypothetical protein
MRPYAEAKNRPLLQKFPIHRFTCGGTHLAYRLVVAARHGYAGPYRRTLQGSSIWWSIGCGRTRP